MSKATGATVKEEVIRMIQRMPDDCTLEDIQYHLFVRARVEEGLAEMRSGQVHTQENIERMVEHRVKSSRFSDRSAPTGETRES